MRRERLGRARVGFALASLVFLALVEPLGSGLGGVAAAGALLAFLAFLRVVRRQRRLAVAADRIGRLEALAREGSARLERDWALLSATPEAGLEPVAPAGHPYGRDLGLSGRASLTRLLGPVTSAAGRERLSSWLLAPASPEEIRLRQDAVRALAPEADARADLAAPGRTGAPEARGALERFLGWAETAGGPRRDRLGPIRWILPPLLIVLGAFHLAGAAPALWVFPLLLQLVILRRRGERIAEEAEAVSSAAPALVRYAAQLERVALLPAKATLLRELREKLGTGDEVPRALRRLTRWLDLADSRDNLFYGPFNLAFLLDLHLERGLEAWRRDHGADARGWIAALAEAEALCALATLAHDHPGWAFPDVSGSGRDVAASDPTAPVRARGLGHPLLPPARCVRNDLDVPGPGAFVLVTGSNMSGKSTLLRALGANVVLAQAGAPVCAEALTMPPLRPHTSMAVEDSLEAGLSRFMAELLRMETIVAAARATGPGDPPVLYLLDEILQGTNTWERRVGARTVLRHLLDAGAIGMVTTHDLTLHEAPDLERRARAFHFRETVERGPEGPALAFDHRLRAGLSTTRNALVLLEAVGLGPLPGQAVEEEPAAQPGGGRSQE